MPLNLAMPWRLLLAALILASGLRYWRRRRSGVITEIQWRGPGQWFVLDRAGDLQATVLQPDSLVTAWFVILRLRLADGRRHSLILCRYSSREADFRRLCVAACYGAFTADSAADAASP